MKEWDDAQKWEKDWHGNCVNSLNEEMKQMAYAKYMGLSIVPDPKTPYRIVTDATSILDVGSGPYSLLLKTEGFKKAYALDPLKYPKWTTQRYKAAGVQVITVQGEDLVPSLVDGGVDEIWCYNCLQHVEDPELVILKMRQTSKIIRYFDWIETGTYVGHLHNLTEKDLNKWFNGEGKVQQINENGGVGLAYFGVFLGDNYDRETKESL